jgi:hypothetical protein
MRLRIRIPNDVGERLAGLRPVLRGQVVATMIEAHALGVDLGQLLATRRELAHLGTMLNQTLRRSRGVLTDAATVQEAAGIIAGLTRK